MKDHALQELKNRSLRIKKGMKIIWPQQGGRVGTVDMGSVIRGHGDQDVFCVKNSVIGFIHGRQYYISPYTRDDLEILKKAGFVEDCFYVPCSHGDLPQESIKRWRELCRLAEKDYAKSFEGECNEYCDAHCIHELPEEALQKCLQIPDEGMEIKLQGVEMVFPPALKRDGVLDTSAKDKLGRYCKSKNLLTFVDRNGKTYLSKGWWLLRKLNDAGYQCTKNFFVPDSLKPSEIMDPVLRAKFASLPEAL